MIVNIMASNNLRSDDTLFNVEVATVDSDKNFVAIGYEDEVEYASFDRPLEGHYVSRANQIWNASSGALNKIIERNPEILNSAINQRHQATFDRVLAGLHCRIYEALREELAVAE